MKNWIELRKPSEILDVDGNKYETEYERKLLWLSVCIKEGTV